MVFADGLCSHWVQISVQAWNSPLTFERSGPAAHTAAIYLARAELKRMELPWALVVPIC